MVSIGDAIQTARRACGITQEELAHQAGITQAALSRYENDVRYPSQQALDAIAERLGVTVRLLQKASRVRGAVAIDAHMRRRATAKATVWRRLEAQINMLDLHAMLLEEEITIRAENRVPLFDPVETPPDDVASMVRSQWRMPSGPVRDLVGWLESAGCIIVDRDFATARVDGLSQWTSGHPVIMVNERMPTDRRRWTLAHELGHLCLHNIEPMPDMKQMEEDADNFASEFLMPASVIRPQLRVLSTGKLLALKRQWGVSAQALVERAHDLETIDARQRTSFYKQFSRLGWRKREPASDEITPERPRLAADIGQALAGRGHTPEDIAQIAGFAEPTSDNPFTPSRRLRIVASPDPVSPHP